MIRRPLAALLALSALAGCGGGSIRESVGLSAPPPNEFLVVARRPLEMPGSMTVLPTPEPGAPSRVEPRPVEEAQAALLGADARGPSPASPTAGEAALVAAAGPSDPRIRETLAADGSVEGERQFGLDSIFGYEIQQNPAAAGEGLEPDEEAERLRAQGVSAPARPPEPEG